MTSAFRKVIAGISLLPGLMACARASYQYQPAIEMSAGPATDTAPQLLFVSFKMTAEPRAIELLRAVAVPGQVPVEINELGREYLKITQLDSRQQPCGIPIQLPHPLLSIVEYPTETAGVMAYSTATLPSAEFFVRLARHPSAVAMRVEEVAANVANPVSTILPLTLTKP